jgi:hypothetical protein
MSDVLGLNSGTAATLNGLTQPGGVNYVLAYDTTNAWLRFFSGSVAGGERMAFFSDTQAAWPVQTVTGGSYVFSSAILGYVTRRSNAGAAMTDLFPAASTLTNGNVLTVDNVDASASIAITAGAGTTIAGGSFYTQGPGRSIFFVYDGPNAEWRPIHDTGVALLGPNNLSDVSSASSALSNLGGLPLAGGTLTGALTLTYGTLPQIKINTAAGIARGVGMYTAGVQRWEFAADQTAESGGNAGSNFSLFAYSDTGAYLGTYLDFNRATALASFAGVILAPAGSEAVPSIVPSGGSNQTGLFYDSVNSGLGVAVGGLAEPAYFTSTGTVVTGLTSTAGRVRKIRAVTAAGAVTVATTDDVVIVNKTTGATTIVNLPSSPTTGQCFYIKDGKGDAATNNITVTPAAGNIDGSATAVINTAYGYMLVIYNGTQWNIIGENGANIL